MFFRIFRKTKAAFEKYIFLPVLLMFMSIYAHAAMLTTSAEASKKERERNLPIRD